MFSVIHPFLDQVGHVGRSSILLKDIGGLARLLDSLQHLWQHLVAQDIQVVRSREPAPCGEPNWSHLLTSRGHDTQHHDTGRVLGLGDVTNVVVSVLKADDAIVLFVVDWIHCKSLFN